MRRVTRSAPTQWAPASSSRSSATSASTPDDPRRPTAKPPSRAWLRPYNDFDPQRVVETRLRSKPPQLLARHALAAPRYGLRESSGLGLSDGDPNPVEWFASVLLGGRGIIESRPWDRFGIGYYYLGLSDEGLVDRLPVDDEQAVETFYSVAVTRAIQVAASIQYVDTGLNLRDDSWTGGLRMFFRF